jgi:hypothetical protein
MFVQTKGLVTFVCIATLISIPLLTITKSSSNNSNYNSQFLQQAFATHMNTATSNETTVTHQGIIASVPSPEVKLQPNEQSQAVIILPHRNDGSIYKGILTYTTSRPVEVALGHVIPIDNATLSQLDKQKFGKLFVREFIKSPGKIGIPSRIIPDYSGSMPPYFSASVPFVASEVLLRTNGEPFIAAYEVSADIIQPKIIKHLENATNTTTAAK